MKKPFQISSCGTSQRGYALLMAMFLVASLVIVGTAASVVIRTEGLRQKEDELAWRGNQYIRGIRLYFRKKGQFPKNLEDLTQYKFGEPRFMRSAYKDPMNNDDGSWRLIYLAPNGQLIGSVMKKSLSIVGNLPGMQGQQGSPSSTQNQPGSQSGAQGTPGQTPPNSPRGTDQQSQNAAQGQTIDQNSSNSQVFGGKLVGVASKVKQPSIRVFNDGHTYFEWEFIWDPSKGGNLPGGQISPGSNPSQQNPNGQQTPPKQTPPQTPQQ